ncbi:MAG: hypothetical protein R3D00_31475 [Bacteroidia bacterium]
MHPIFPDIIQNYPQLKYALLEAQTFDSRHFGFPQIYYDIMETDKLRVGKFADTFQQYNYFKDLVVCEAGVGRLALTQHYLPFVKKAYLIENNPDLQPFLETEIARMGLSHKVELLFGDARKVSLPEPVDALIGELMSIFCANEFQVQIFRHLRQFLKPDGVMIPEKIVNTAQICEAEFEGEIAHYPLCFMRHLPTLLSLPAIVNTIDLRTITAPVETFSTPITCLNPGQANAILLNSYVHLSGQNAFTGTDSLMPPTVCKLSAHHAIRPGDISILSSTIRYGTSLEECIFSLE